MEKNNYAATSGPDKKNILRLISGSERLTIEPLSGQETIDKADGESLSFKLLMLDSKIKDLGLDQPGSATDEILPVVHEMNDDGTFLQVFTNLTTDLDKVTMSQAQIIRFCEKYTDWLCQKRCPTLFLTKVAGNQYFVVLVYVRSYSYSEDGLRIRLRARMRPLEYGAKWHGCAHRRVISPLKLAA